MFCPRELNPVLGCPDWVRAVSCEPLGCEPTAPLTRSPPPSASATDCWDRAACSVLPAPARARAHTQCSTHSRASGWQLTDHLVHRAPQCPRPPARPLAGCARACEPCRRHQPAHRRELHCPVHVARPALQPEPHQIRPSRGRSRTGAGAARGQGGPYLPEAAWDAAQETGARAWRWRSCCTCASRCRSIQCFCGSLHRLAGCFIK